MLRISHHARERTNSRASALNNEHNGKTKKKAIMFQNMQMLFERCPHTWLNLNKTDRKLATIKTWWENASCYKVYYSSGGQQLSEKKNYDFLNQVIKYYQVEDIFPLSVLKKFPNKLFSPSILPFSMFLNYPLPDHPHPVQLACYIVQWIWWWNAFGILHSTSKIGNKFLHTFHIHRNLYTI